MLDLVNDKVKDRVLHHRHGQMVKLSHNIGQRIDKGLLVPTGVDLTLNPKGLIHMIQNMECLDQVHRHFRNVRIDQGADQHNRLMPQLLVLMVDTLDYPSHEFVVVKD